MKKIYCYISTKKIHYKKNIIKPGDIIYIGCTNDLLSRHHQHLDLSSIKKQRINNFLQKHPNSWEVYEIDIALNNLYGEYVKPFNFNQKKSYKWEKLLINFFKPLLNVN